MVYFEWLIQTNVSELLQHGRARRSVFGPQNRAEIFCRSLPPKSAFLLQPDDVRLLSEDQPRSGRVELKLLRPFKERSRSRRGGLQTATMEVGALHVLTSNGPFMLGKIEQDGTRRINDKRGEIQPVFSSLSVGTGTPLMCKCHSELA